MKFSSRCFWVFMALFSLSTVHSQDSISSESPEEQQAKILVRDDHTSQATLQIPPQKAEPGIEKKYIIAFHQEDVVSLATSFQIQALNSRSLGLYSFLSQGWIYLSPRYDFHWGYYSNSGYSAHIASLGSGCTVVLDPGIRLFLGTVIGTGWVSSTRTVSSFSAYTGQQIQNLDDSGLYLTTLGSELGVTYAFSGTGVLAGFKIFTGYERGMDWIFGNQGLTLSGAFHLGWKL